MLSVLKGSGTRGQFVRYSVVGVTGTVVDLGVLNILLHSNPWFLAYPAFANCISFSYAVVNNFILNKFWTFRQPRVDAVETSADGAAAAVIDSAPVRMDKQFAIFVFVSVVGLTMNTAIMLFISHLPQVVSLAGAKGAINVGKLIAIPIVWMWNFGANKLWTFRKG